MSSGGSDAVNESIRDYKKRIAKLEAKRYSKECSQCNDRQITIDKLQTQLTEANAKVERLTKIETIANKIYECNFNRELDDVHEELYEALLPQQDKQTRTKIPEDVTTVRNVVTGKTTPTRGDE